MMGFGLKGDSLPPTTGFPIVIWFCNISHTLDQTTKEREESNTPVLSGPPSSLDCPLRSDKSQGVERREILLP